jgi:hypothetical protein
LRGGFRPTSYKQKNKKKKKKRKKRKEKERKKKESEAYDITVKTVKLATSIT